jgi:KipI family sensor histidine kinase inhibitor
MSHRIYPLSESAATVEWGDRMDDALHQQVLRLDLALRQQPFVGWVENVPAYASLTVFYRPELLVEHSDLSPFLSVKKVLEARLLALPEALPVARKVVSVPVCYDEPFGPDLELVAMQNGLSPEQVITLHQQKQYQVYMMGFLPGFAYMGILDESIAAPRKETPRPKVAAGSVGIAGRQTGIYPQDAPGGWQIIGRTPLRLFDPEKTDPFLFRTGDQVRFHAITPGEFHQLQQQAAEKPRNTPNPTLPAHAEVLKPGLFTTLQDQGRPGFRAFGVPSGGAMDRHAHDLANALVGNSPEAATLECTMGGLVLQFHTTARLAITGAGEAFVNGQRIAMYQPCTVAEQDVLEIRFNRHGLRTYLAVQGGFTAPTLMHSKSMSPTIGIGAPLKKGDGLWFDRQVADQPPVRPEVQPPDWSGAIRVFPGPEYNWLTLESRERLFTQPFTLSQRSDRMGCHLQAEPLHFIQPRELLSTAVTAGTIQCTPGGQLILLMQDCQTTGGYPRVGQIAAVDLPKVAQWIPGERRSFVLEGAKS